MTRTKHGSRRAVFTSLLALMILGGGVSNATSARVNAQDPTGVTTIVGTMSLDLAADVQMYVGLIDLTGFVRRDYSYAQGDTLITGLIDHASGAFQVALPIAPSAPLNQVGGGDAATGVQIFSVDRIGNKLGDLGLSPLEFQGWSWGNTSLMTAHGTHEIVGGHLVVWSPDDVQRFPTDFGADGKLFTADDPVGPIGTGWTVVDLNARPFVQNRASRADVAIGLNELEPVDLSSLTPTAAFDQLIDRLRVRYPFAKERPIDWDALRATYRPEFEAAEQTGSQTDFWVALNHLVIEIETYTLFAMYPWDDYFVQRFQGATGLHVRLSDDDRVIVAKVVAELPAESAGIKAGAELISWDGLPSRQAVDATVQYFPTSSPHAILNQKLAMFGRLPLGTSVLVDYRNPGESETVSTTLTPVALPDEMDIQTTALCYRVWLDCQQPLVVWAEFLPSGIGVIHVSLLNSDSQKYRLTLDLWERWLMWFTFTDVPALIVDLRWPSYSDSDAPTSALSMAGSFFPEPLPLAEMTSVDANGNDVTVGTATVLPSPIQWDRPVAVLVDEQCVETCELLTLAMSHRPNVIIAGMSATGGSLSGIREPILMPTGNFVQVVDLAYRDPVTHDLLIQGVGIEPTLRIPKTAETLVTDVTTDIVLNAAEQALLAQIAGADSD